MKPVRKDLLETLRGAYQQLSDQQRGDVRPSAGLTKTLYGLGLGSADLGDHGQAEGAYKQGRDVARQLSDADPNNVSALEMQYRCITNLAGLMQTLAAQTPLPGGTRYLAACVYSLAFAAARNDASLSVADRQRLTEDYARRALAMLGKARAAGWFRAAGRVEQLRTDPEFEALRGLEDCRVPLAELGQMK